MLEITGGILASSSRYWFVNINLAVGYPVSQFEAAAGVRSVLNNKEKVLS